MGRFARLKIGVVVFVASMSVLAGVPALAVSNVGSVGTWSTNAHPLPLDVSGAATVTANGYVYVIGGSSSSGPTWINSVYYAKLNADGSTGAWTTSSNPVPSGSYYPSATVANGYLYVMGGYGGSFKNTAYYAKLGSDGSVGTWASAPNLPQGLYEASAVTYGSYVYVIGGLDSSSSALDTTYYAKVNADGSLGSWTTSSNHMPQGIDDAGGVAANGRVYMLGGSNNSGYTNSAYYASFNADGSIGAWTTSPTLLPDTLDGAMASSSNGYLYLAGGANNTATQGGVYYAKLGADGSIGAWTTSTNSLPQPLQYGGSIIANGYLYAIAGQNTGMTQSTVYYAPLTFVSNQTITDTATGQPFTLTTPAHTNITNLSMLTNPPSDSGYTYPLGLVSFTFASDSASNQISLVFQTNLQPSQVVARKYNATTNTYSTIPGAVISVTTLNGSPALQLTYTITDGGSLDQDGAANGIIVDPVGLAQANTVAASSATAPNTGYGKPTGQAPLFIAAVSAALFAGGVTLQMVKRRKMQTSAQNH